MAKIARANVQKQKAIQGKIGSRALIFECYTPIGHSDSKSLPGGARINPARGIKTNRGK